MAQEISNSEDTLDVRDIIERFEELEDNTTRDEYEQDEYNAISAAINELKGNGGNHQWRGDWYPVTLIRGSYFEEYAQELAEDIGSINRNMQWPLGCIDWEKAAAELQMDYSTAEFDGVTYWYR